MRDLFSQLPDLELAGTGPAAELSRLRHGRTLAPRPKEDNKLRLHDRAAHQWYRFVLSFPPHLVRDCVSKFGLTSRHRVLDPFCGTGTTVVECKKLGIPAFGLEPNPVACFAGRTKVQWSVDPQKLLRHARANYNNGASNTVFFSNFAVDTVPINVVVTSIQNTTYTSKDIPLSFTVDKAVSWTAYSLDGQANLTTPQDTTLTGLSYGTHTLTVYAKDSIGLIEASDTIRFEVTDKAIPEFPSWIILPILAIMLTNAGLLVYLKKHKHQP